MTYKRRYLHNFLAKRPEHFRVVIITGPRRSGKSTLSRELLKDWGGTTYISFDTPAEQARFASDPEGYLRSVETPAVLDEVQNVPQIFSYIKKIVDERPEDPCSYILTGSQQFQMMKHVSESLAGRALVKELLPFCVGELEEEAPSRFEHNFNSLSSDNPKFQASASPKSKADILSLIVRGGFPKVSQMSSEAEIYDWFSSYVATYVQRDIRALSNIQDLSLFSRFVSLVAGRTAQTINYSQIGKDLGINYKTAQHYISLLTSSYLWASIPPFFKANSEKRLSKSPKGFFLDTGLALFMAGASAEGLERNPLYGAIFETFVFNELLKLSFVFSRRHNFLHFRANENQKVDLVLEMGQQLIPIEIKATGTLGKNWGRGARAFKKISGLPPSSPAYVISMYQEVVRLEDGLTNLPIQLFI